MLGKEELMEQFVDLQQSLAIEPQTAVVKRQKALALQFPQAQCEPLLRVNAKLPAEVVTVDMTELHLQDELSDHSFFMRGGQGSVDRKRAFLELSEVRSPVMLILEVGASNV